MITKSAEIVLKELDNGEAIVCIHQFGREMHLDSLDYYDVNEYVLYLRSQGRGTSRETVTYDAQPKDEDTKHLIEQGIVHLEGIVKRKQNAEKLLSNIAVAVKER